MSDKIQLIGDADFENGFYVISQKNHAQGDSCKTLGNFTYGRSVTPLWSICQWDSGPCLWTDRKPSLKNVITDGVTKTARYDTETKMLSLSLNSKKYYNGKGAVQGEFWPHLLIEQSRYWQYYHVDDVKKARYRMLPNNRLNASFDVRLASYSLEEIDGDWVRAGQLLMFFYIKTVETDDFIWFGLPLFDNRDPDVKRYIALDGGKPDASHALIYSLSHGEVYGSGKRPSPEYSGFAHVEVRLNDYIREAYDYGRRTGYFKCGDFSKLYIGGMNYGWELIGSFDVTAEIKNLSLTSEMT